MNKSLKRRLRRAARKAAVRAAGTVARKVGPPGVDRAVERAMNKVLSTPMKGSGFYSQGSGMSGRGAYNFLGGQTMIEHQQPAVFNNLIEGGANRHTTVAQIGDETSDSVYTRSEYISDIFVPNDPGNFHNRGYAINPGLTGTFPWLAQVAANFSEYELVQCMLEYRPVVSKFSSSGQMGTIMLASNVNSAEPIFTSKREMIAHNGCEPTSIAGPSFVGIECDPRKNGGSRSRFVRAGAVPGGQDQKTYDMGMIQIATQGIDPLAFAVGSQLGMLYVHYKVILRKPRLYDALGKSQSSDIFVAGGNLSNNYMLLGTQPKAGNFNSLGGRITFDPLNLTYFRYTFPDDFAGHVLFTLFKNGYTGNNMALAVNAAANISSFECVESEIGIPASYFHIGGSNGAGMYHYRVGAPESSETNFIDISLANAADVITGGFMKVDRINPLNSDTSRYVTI